MNPLVDDQEILPNFIFTSLVWDNPFSRISINLFCKYNIVLINALMARVYYKRLGNQCSSTSFKGVFTGNVYGITLMSHQVVYFMC